MSLLPFATTVVMIEEPLDTMATVRFDIRKDENESNKPSLFPNIYSSSLLFFILQNYIIYISAYLGSLPSWNNFFQYYRCAWTYLLSTNIIIQTIK